MTDITTLLDRTTPQDLGPLDLEGLGRRERRRRVRRRVAQLSAVGALAIATAVTVTGRDDEGNRADVTMPPLGPGGQPLAEPVGQWTQAQDAPFAPRSGAFGGALSDGRVVVWGGHSDAGDDPNDPNAQPSGYADGGILDPATGEWTPIPEAPIPAPTEGGASVTTAQLVDDRLAVVTGSTDRTLNAAVYDVASGHWTDAPEITAIPYGYDGMAWDGETLALVRLSPGEDDWQVARAVTLRWAPGDDRWVLGSPPPLPMRNLSGQAFDGARLALWGGTTATSIDDSGGHDVFADGAIYDVGSDTWHRMPAGPPGRTHASLVWAGARLLLGGGIGAGEDSGEQRLMPDVWAYDLETDEWEALPDAPAGGLAPSPRDVAAVNPPLVVTETMEYPASRWVSTSAGWEQAPLPGLAQVGELTVATNQALGNPGPGPFALQVRVAPDQWFDAAAAPFDGRMAATIVATADRLVVVGGLAGQDLRLESDTWVFDLAG
jgi:Galactose oxidase, central domain